MRAKSMWAIGLVSMMIAVGAGSAANSFAADVNRGNGIERVGVGGSVYSSSQTDGAGDCQMARRKADMEQRIGAGGSTYTFSQPPSAQASVCQVAGKRVEVEQRIGHGGSTYSFSQPIVQAACR